MSDRTFDRIPSADPRSANFPMRALVGETNPLRSYTWRHVQLDQGAEGACTGFAATMEAAARPKPVFGDPVRKPPDVAALNQVARDVYHRAQQIDEWPGEAYSGSSVLAAMKVGVERGWWTGYRWATGGVSDIALALGYHGPVVMGTSWWSGMSWPDEPGVLKPTGDVLGGHAWLLTAYSKKRNAFWTPNSWGGAGQGWIGFDNLAALLGAGGEAAVPVNRAMS